MSTKFPDIFQALAAPFAEEEVKTRKGDRGRTLSYVTARTVMNRLDEVLGAENWHDSYHASPVANRQGVLCQLAIRLPDGQEVTKQGIGGVTTMHDPSDTDKTGESDALKRAAVKFGVGRYLYQDGVPAFEPADNEPRAGAPSVPFAARGRAPASATRPARSERPPAPPREGSYQAWLTEQAAELGLASIWELHGYVVRLLKESDYPFGCDVADKRGVFRAVAQMYEGGTAGEWMADAVARFRAHQVV